MGKKILKYGSLVFNLDDFSMIQKKEFTVIAIHKNSGFLVELFKGTDARCNEFLDFVWRSRQ